MPDKARTFSEKIVPVAGAPSWLGLMFVVYGGMAAVMARGWFIDPRETFYLIMGAMFAGWAFENAIKVLLPSGNHLGATLVPTMAILVACTYLYGRDGDWTSGAVVLVIVAGTIIAAIVSAATMPASRAAAGPSDDKNV